MALAVNKGPAFHITSNITSVRFLTSALVFWSRVVDRVQGAHKPARERIALFLLWPCTVA